MLVEIKKSIQKLLLGGLILIPPFLFQVNICFSEEIFIDNQYNKIVEIALKNKLSDSYIWKSLLHTKNGKLNIKDPDFIISLNNYSLENELEKTIQSFFENSNNISKHPICKFPARYFWIKSELGLTDDIFPNVSCPDFEEYKNKTSNQNISLIFVSEDISQPSSMMGHVFLKLSGQDNNTNYVAHAVSFYTVIGTVNIPILIIRSTLTGMKGFFSLLPYEEQIKKYLEVQNRNVWEYELDLPENVKKLIYYHIWELKDVKFKYLFTDYNCATVIYNILSLSSDEFLNHNNYLWITPKSVIKEASNDNLIRNTKLVPSDKWKIRMLSETLDKESVKNIYNYVDGKSAEHIRLSNNSKIKILQCELIKTYIDYKYKNEKINTNEFNIMDHNIMDICNISGKVENVSIDLSQYKSPIKTFPERQVGIGYKYLGKNNYGKLYFLPASNTLSDDNREYFNENSLKLGETSILINNNNNINVESIQLYSMQNLLPVDMFLKEISEEVKVGGEQQYDKQLNNHLAMNISAGLGLTNKISTDMNCYIIINGGAGFGKSRFYIYGFPEVGITIYEVMNMKTIMSYKYVYNQMENNNYYYNYNITQSYYWKSKYKINATYEHIYNKSYKNDNFEIMFNIYL